jgi:hypothetical protein
MHDDDEVFWGLVRLGILLGELQHSVSVKFGTPT